MSQKRVYIIVTQMTLIVNIGITIKKISTLAFRGTSVHPSDSRPIGLFFFLFLSHLYEVSFWGVSKQA